VAAVGDLEIATETGVPAGSTGPLPDKPGRQTETCRRGRGDLFEDLICCAVFKFGPTSKVLPWEASGKPVRLTVRPGNFAPGRKMSCALSVISLMTISSTLGAAMRTGAAWTDRTCS